MMTMKPPADTVIYNAVMRRLGGGHPSFRDLTDAARETAAELGLTVERVMAVVEDEQQSRERDAGPS